MSISFNDLKSSNKVGSKTVFEWPKLSFYLSDKFNKKSSEPFACARKEDFGSANKHIIYIIYLNDLDNKLLL